MWLDLLAQDCGQANAQVEFLISLQDSKGRICLQKGCVFTHFEHIRSNV